MNPPNVIIRLIGSPAIALVLFAACSSIIFAWAYGPCPWLFAFIALGIAFRTTRSVFEVRRYKTWAKGWKNLQSEVTGDVPARNPAASMSRLRVFAAVLLFFAIAVCFSSEQAQGTKNALLVFWMIDSIYLGWLVLALLGRAAKRSMRALKGKHASGANEQPVSWVLPRASSSPTRAQVQKELPAHVLRLMDNGVPLASRLKARSSERVSKRVPA